MAKPPDAETDRTEGLPFGLGWRAIYGIVLGALALQIAVYAALTARFG